MAVHYCKTRQDDVLAGIYMTRCRSRTSKMATSNSPCSKAEQLLGVLSSHLEVRLTLWLCYFTLESAASRLWSYLGRSAASPGMSRCKV